MSDLPLLDWTPPKGPFHGSTYVAELDEKRLGEQELDVWRAIKDGRRFTLRSLSFKTDHPEASCSARIRGIRSKLEQAKLGTIQRERVPGGNGLWEYWVVKA